MALVNLLPHYAAEPEVLASLYQGLYALLGQPHGAEWEGEDWDRNFERVPELLTICSAALDAAELFGEDKELVCWAVGVVGFATLNEACCDKFGPTTVPLVRCCCSHRAPSPPPPPRETGDPGHRLVHGRGRGAAAENCD
jgi:hypothetical protein